MRKLLSILVLLVMLLTACGNTQVQGDGLPDTITESPVKGEQVAEQETPQDSDDAIGTQAEAKENQAQTQEPSSTSEAQVREFKMEAKQFAFEPSTIEINKGDKVRLIVTSKDVPHGIAIPEYGINERLPVDEPVTIEFTADKSGTFTAYCSVACGPGHGRMRGSIVVN